MYIVKTKENATGRINIKIKPSLHADFQIAADLSGETMSTLIRRFIVNVVREAKRTSPEAFPVKTRNDIQPDRKDVASHDGDDNNEKGSRMIELLDIEDNANSDEAAG